MSRRIVKGRRPTVEEAMDAIQREAVGRGMRVHGNPILQTTLTGVEFSAVLVDDKKKP